MIRIISNKFQDSMVDEYVLDSLILSKKVIAFYRSNEWVVIGKDAVRAQNTFYSGKERRKTIYGNDFCMK